MGLLYFYSTTELYVKQSKKDKIILHNRPNLKGNCYVLHDIPLHFVRLKYQEIIIQTYIKSSTKNLIMSLNENFGYSVKFACRIITRQLLQYKSNNALYTCMQTQFGLL